MTLEESALEKDEVIEKNGIHFLVHEGDKVYFDHAKIDYTRTVFGEQFQVLQV